MFKHIYGEKGKRRRREVTRIDNDMVNTFSKP